MTHAPPTPPVLRCQNTADFLAALPFLTGFVATDSLFIIAFQGKRAGPVLRIDLPSAQAPTELSTFTDAVADLLSTSGFGAGRPAVVIHTTARFSECQAPPWRRLAHMLERRCRRRGFGFRELACVAADGWVSLHDTQAPKCGRPLDEILLSPVALEARVHLDEASHPVAHDSLSEIPVGDPVRQAAVQRALKTDDGAEHARTGQTPAGQTPAGQAPATSAAHDAHRSNKISGAQEAHLPRELITNACRSLTTSSPQPPPIEHLVFFARTGTGCKSWLLLFCSALLGVERLERAFRAGDALGASPLGIASLVTGPPDMIAERLATLLRTFVVEAPDQAQLRQALARLTAATADLPDSQRGGPLSLLAALWWALGMQSVASKLLRLANERGAEPAICAGVEQAIDSPPTWCLTALAQISDPANASPMQPQPQP